MMRSASVVLAAALAAAPAAIAQNATQPPPPAAPHAQASRPVSLSPPLVARMQRSLQADGLYKGQIDGKFGPLTRHALEEFQSANQLRPTGNPDPATLAALGAPNTPGQQQAGAAGQPQAAQTPAQARAERLKAYQAREGAKTRAGARASPGWAASAAPGEGESGLAPGSLTAQSGSLTSVTNALANNAAASSTAPSAPRGFFGYSSNMSNGFNAATGRQR